jgi:hypothetical protein
MRFGCLDGAVNVSLPALQLSVFGRRFSERGVDARV